MVRRELHARDGHCCKPEVGWLKRPDANTACLRAWRSERCFQQHYNTSSVREMCGCMALVFTLLTHPQFMRAATHKMLLNTATITTAGPHTPVASCLEFVLLLVEFPGSFDFLRKRQPKTASTNQGGRSQHDKAAASVRPFAASQRP